jgi:hypothetical protein
MRVIEARVVIFYCNFISIKMVFLFPPLKGALCVVVTGNLGFCLCANGFYGPYCQFVNASATTIPAQTFPAATTSLNVAQCNPSAFLNNQNCLYINGVATCFCQNGFVPPLCASSTLAPTGTTALTTGTTISERV